MPGMIVLKFYIICLRAYKTIVPLYLGTHDCNKPRYLGEKSKNWDDAIFLAKDLNYQPYQNFIALDAKIMLWILQIEKPKP